MKLYILNYYKFIGNVNLSIFLYKKMCLPEISMKPIHNNNNNNNNNVY